MLISEVEARNKILFGSLSSGISTKTKKKLAWENLAPSVNEVGADSPTVADIRKKVVGHQGEHKKKVSAHRTIVGQTAAEPESGSSPHLSTSIPPACFYILIYLDAC